MQGAHLKGLTMGSAYRTFASNDTTFASELVTAYNKITKRDAKDYNEVIDTIVDLDNGAQTELYEKINK